MTALLTAEAWPKLLERDHELAALSGRLDAVRDERCGRLLLLGGGAGVGKTSLLRRFCAEQPSSTPILWGSCDALFTPRPLGPLLDIARLTGGELERIVEDGKPHQVATALMHELSTGTPQIVVLEDLHWADEATLDVVGILGRRIETVPALVVASYRDDELDSTHPLRLVLGDLATVRFVERTKLPPLSPAAVAELAGPHGVDPEELYRVTGGNPFFVTEALAAGTETVLPSTIRDAVLARAARLGAPARELLEVVAIAPPQAELWLLEAVAGDSLANLDECLASGMLDSQPNAIAFHHELARLAIEDAITPHRRTALHKLALAVLAEPPAGQQDLARLAHHAEAAGDAEAVLRFAPAAGERAASLGAHREAAAQYARALRFGEYASPEQRAGLLERRSYECYVTDQAPEAIDALEHAIEHYRAVGDAPKEGVALAMLARRVWCNGVGESKRIVLDAISILEGIPESRDLTVAYSTAASVAMNAEHAAETRTWGERALELARKFDDAESTVYVLNSVGTMEALRGMPEGFEKLERSLALARDAGLEDHAGRAFIHTAWAVMRTRRYDLLDRIEVGIDWCGEHGLDLWRLYLLAYRARIDLDRGRWEEAADAASFVLTHRRTAVLLKILALTVLGLVRARRGDPDHRRLLDEALELTEVANELQHVAPVAAARGEIAWLEGDFDAVARETRSCLELAQRCEAPWVIGELAFWRRQAGLEEDLSADAAEPYAAQLRGEWQHAADLWMQIGCPYEAGLAIADADDEQMARRGLDELQALGARPAATIVARRLRERGASGLPRGPRPATRTNPANLTSREVEVLALVSQGLRNAQIAERLFVSEKTVDHHVSAILRKLGARTRMQAAAEAARLGIALDGN
jgi:DNA-binding CsgD family transcriptional regulator